MLSKRLSSVLEAHIRTQLPEISKKIKSMLRETQEDLVRYGVRGPSTPFECRSTVMKAIQEFCEKFREAMNGETRRNTYKGLFGPARIREIFRNEFPHEVASLDASYLSDKEIQMARRNAVGLHADLFVPNSAFEVCVCRAELSLSILVTDLRSSPPDGDPLLVVAMSSLPPSLPPSLS